MIRARHWSLAILLATPVVANAFSFTPDSYYASTGSSIVQYAADGTILDSVRPTGATSIGTDTRGIAFGGDGLMYVVRNNQLDINGAGNAGVDAMDSSGNVVRSYTFSGWISGQATAGDIAFSNDGKSFYVGATSGVYQFDVNSQVGQRISGLEANDLAVMPNGDLLVASENDFSRLSSDGTLLQTIDSDINDPQGLAKPYSKFGDISLANIRGIAYDPTSDTTYVSMLGYSFKVLALDGFTSTLKGITSYRYASDLFVTDQQKLLVGSWSQAPAVFDPELNLLTQLGSTSAVFVTAMSVPEPGTVGMMLLGLGGVAALSTRRRAHRA
ncbi:MAG: PEP-CTERM sorting domain-containing protein [Aquabacterium sp.]